MRRALFVSIVLAALAVALLPVVLQAPHTRAPSARASVLIGGDMMFDRYIRRVTSIAGGDFVFSCIDRILLPAELVVANLEGPITDNPSVSTGAAVADPDNFTFTFSPETAALLARHNIHMVSLGNNHILNFGETGKRSTTTYLDAAGVAYLDELTPATTTLSGVRLAFVNYNEFSGNQAGMIYHTTSTIERLKTEGYLPVVYAHWGDEYAPVTAEQKQLAHMFVDAGAVLVVGSHPHVVQEHETYNGVPIYYSLGNFIFDQYFSEEVRHGLLIKVIFSESGVAGIEEIPTTLETDGRTCYH